MRLADDDTAPYTPETHPGLSPEACAILNTPVEDCDPDILRLIVVGLAVHIADRLQLDDAEAKAMFATLSQRLGAPLGHTPDEPPPSPMAKPEPPPVSPGEPPEALPANSPDSLETAAAPQAPPDSATPWQRGLQRSRPLRPGRHRLFRGGRSVLPRVVHDKRRGLPPPRLCYAACTGPP